MFLVQLNPVIGTAFLYWRRQRKDHGCGGNDVDFSVLNLDGKKDTSFFGRACSEERFCCLPLLLCLILLSPGKVQHLYPSTSSHSHLLSDSSVQHEPFFGERKRRFSCHSLVGSNQTSFCSKRERTPAKAFLSLLATSMPARPLLTPLEPPSGQGAWTNSFTMVHHF